MSNDDIEKENKTKKDVNSCYFSNRWIESSNWKHYTWKNHEAQFLGNKTLKDGIERKRITKTIQNKK
jgi:hypothetical protein